MYKKHTYLRKDGRWESRITVGKSDNGKRVYRSFYGKSSAEAELKCDLAVKRFAEDYAITKMTVSELCNEWLNAVSIRLKESTLANYIMKVDKHIIPAFGEQQICLLKAKDINIFIDNKLKSGLSARYISDIIVLLKSVFRYAQGEYHIKNIMENIVMPKKKKPEIAILNEEQRHRLDLYIAENHDTTSLGISLAMYMGIRIGELCALKWEDFDLEKRTITVKHTIQRIQCVNGDKRTKLVITEPKTASSKREIPIPDFLVPMLESMQKSSEIYVFSGKVKPYEPRVMQSRFAKILKNENLPSVHFHSLRHLFATNCIAIGFDVKTLSEVLGHSSIEVTLNRYVHTDMNRKRTCMNLVNSTISPSF